MKHIKYPKDQGPRNAAEEVTTSTAELNESRSEFSSSGDEVARRAYFSYVNQGSLPGHDVQHWLEAEAELLAERNLTRVELGSGQLTSENHIMKTPITKLGETLEPPAFQSVIRQRGAKSASPSLKPQKRDNVFSKSRDTREDRGARQMKTSHNSQSLPHGG